MKYEKQRISPLLFTVYSAAASGRSPALPCFAALLVLVRFSGLFAFTQFIFQTLADISDDDLQLVVDMINNRPRKRLNYLTPFEVLKKFFS